jgi:hypothetical protein
MNYEACGPFQCKPRQALDKRALEISFKFLKYHPKSARILTFHEYEMIRTNYPTVDDIHDRQLYIVEDGNFSVLMIVSSTGDSLNKLCTLK